MILRVGGRTYCGAVVDVRDADVAVDGAAVAAAIRGGDSPYGAHCRPPSEVHERAGFVRPGTGLAARTALAAAGRSRGLTTPHDDDLAAVRAELDALREELASLEETSAHSGTGPTPPDADRERLRERVAEQRGRIQALEADDRDASDARSTLRDTARRLSELETERVAALETREQVRELRDRRERQLRLEDREANLERAARASLVDELRDRFAAAVGSLESADHCGELSGSTDTDPSVADPPDAFPSETGACDVDPFDVDPVTASLAVLRVARVCAPVVLAVDRFEHPAVAAEWLGAPVVRL